MSAITGGAMDRQKIERIRKENSLDDKLLHRKGVVGVDVGLKKVNGLNTTELCLIVYVKKKRPIAELSPDEAIPSLIAGIPTNEYA